MARARVRRFAPETADPDEVRTFASGLSDKYLECRNYGHPWRNLHAGRYRDGGFRIVRRCPRCKTRKTWELSASGEILSTSSKYPDDYLASGMGRIAADGRCAMRIESVTRFVSDEDNYVDEED